MFQNGTLYLEEPLNYEQQSRYHLHAIANDSEHVSSELEITISVLNVNDHPPMFIQVSYTVELLENEPVGTVLATIQATDDDAQSLDGSTVTPPPLFALVTRYQVLEDGVPFEVRLNPETNAGVLVNTDSLDFESDHCSYSITVVAFDGGNKSSLIPARVRIELKNLNDNPFYFSNDTYHFTLQENFAGEIGSVSIIDDDFLSSKGCPSSHSSMLTNVTFIVYGQSGDGSAFNIDSNGLISNVEPFDYESSDHELVLLVSAGDSFYSSGDGDKLVIVSSVHDKTCR